MILGKNAQNVQKITDLIKKNPRTTLLELEQDTGISKTTIGRIVTKDLKLKKTPAKFIPRFLTNEQKLCRLATCENMLEITRTDPEWKDKIITGDETWVYDYDPETKRQYADGRGQGEPRPKKSRILKSRKRIGHHVTQKDQLAENLKIRGQGKEETSDSYIQDVLHLCREVNPAMMENEIVAHLTKGISEEIYQSIIILDIATIDEFIKWCRKIEASNKKRVNKRVVFDRLPNVAAIDSADSESMEDLIRRIVREEVHRALNPESTTPEPSSLKEIIREEIEKTPPYKPIPTPLQSRKKLSVASSFEGEAAGVKNPPSSTAAKLQQNYVEIIIDDIAFSALVDSGSSFSVISDGLRRQLKKTMFKEDSGMTLKVADGKNVTSIGRCTISLSINGLEQPLEFIVLPNINPSIILGWDFLETSNAVIDCGRAEIRLGKRPKMY
ncbi:hypothetical protein LAZ67_2005417 [Cordylochernes scorpioides]|uniref:Peptidase A2 domain-containing protein n=1 Tax=Cordylochernes scorpioides TaxID=51811 RepID=A0ABY6K4C0_9ARAC|nr:hypothetical protein LAZ67_2005417 [Cordylochernes scorpioides]